VVGVLSRPFALSARWQLGKSQVIGHRRWWPVWPAGSQSKALRRQWTRRPGLHHKINKSRRDWILAVSYVETLVSAERERALAGSAPCSTWE